MAGNMKETHYQTIAQALDDYYTVDALKPIAKLVCEAIPQTVITLLNDAKERTTRLSYSGRAHLIECRDPVLVQLISSDRKLSRMCLPAGDRHIIVLPGVEKPFIKSLADIGYIVPQLREQI